jgi:hypothetical protein
MQPTAEQIDLACRVAIATLYGDAHTAAGLIADYDAARDATREQVIRLSERMLLQALREAEEDMNLILKAGEPIPLRAFLAETNLLNATKAKSL